MGKSWNLLTLILAFTVFLVMCSRVSVRSGRFNRHTADGNCRLISSRQMAKEGETLQVRNKWFKMFLASYWNVQDWEEMRIFMYGALISFRFIMTKNIILSTTLWVPVATVSFLFSVYFTFSFRVVGIIFVNNLILLGGL